MTLFYHLSLQWHRLLAFWRGDKAQTAYLAYLLRASQERSSRHNKPSPRIEIENPDTAEEKSP